MDAYSPDIMLVMDSPGMLPVASIFELDYLAHMVPRVLGVIAIGAIIGFPFGRLSFRKTGSEGRAITVGAAWGVSGLVVLAIVYFMFVLCPPGAGCA